MYAIHTWRDIIICAQWRDNICAHPHNWLNMSFVYFYAMYIIMLALNMITRSGICELQGLNQCVES